MRELIDGNFLLGTRAARRLYFDFACDMPIFDYHCHLPVADIAANRGFDNLSQAWLAGDHYKWRAMRANGTAERLITGDASDAEKFRAWAETVPTTIGNPLYHWTHLELRRYFGIRGALGPHNAAAVYDDCSRKLRGEQFHARGLLREMNVRVLCTTDDPADSLANHQRLAEDRSFPVTVLPAFRPDPAMAIEMPGPFNAWVDRLAAAADTEVRDYKTFLDALRLRRDVFHAQGCRISDHGIEVPSAEDFTEPEVRQVFLDARAGRAPGPREAAIFRSAMLVELGRMYAEKSWAWQLHLGAVRDINTRGLRSLGPNTGYDTIGDSALVRPLARLLDRLDAEGRLPKTILYSLNPGDTPALAALIGCFSEEGVRGKMQLGSAWWFNDQKDGMESQMRTLASMGLLARFVGMLTDSRSFLSFPRHEYFRRVLCGMLGDQVESGEMPRDFALLGGMIKDICWNNAAAYFALPLKEIPPA